MRLIIDDRVIIHDELAHWVTTHLNDDGEYGVIAKTIEEWESGAAAINMRTSGSTGIPKLIQHSRESIIASANKTAQYFDIKPGATALLCMPCKYVAGKMMLLRALILDLDLIIVPPSSRPLKGISTQIDFAPMTPLQLQSTLDNGDPINLVSKVLLGGAPVNRELEERITSLTPQFYLGYGMTETITHVAVRPLTKDSKGEFQALEGVSFKTKEDCLIIYADHISASPITTNDIVDIKSETTFIWKGRKDNVINSGGVKVFPEIIENKIRNIIDTRFFIVGSQDNKLGSKVTLVLESAPLTDNEENDVLCRIREVVGKYEVPREVIYLEEFTTTETGKIKRSF